MLFSLLFLEYNILRPFTRINIAFFAEKNLNSFSRFFYHSSERKGAKGNAFPLPVFSRQKTKAELVLQKLVKSQREENLVESSTQAK